MNAETFRKAVKLFMTMNMIASVVMIVVGLYMILAYGASVWTFLAGLMFAIYNRISLGLVND